MSRIIADPPPPPRSNLRHRIVASSVGSILTALAVTPLEVVKVRRQAAAAMEPRSVTFCDPPSSVPLTPSHAPKLSENSGTFGMLRRILLQEGLPGMYAGLRPTLLMAVPNTAVYFTAYEALVWRLRQHVFTDTLSAAPLVAGGTAKFLASSLTAPLELVRTRQAVALAISGQQAQPSLWSEIRTLVAQDGVRALYRGWMPTLWRDVPFSAFFFLSLEHSRTLWKKSPSSESLSWQQQMGQEMVNGAVAGTVATKMTTPFDVAKTRQQVGTYNRSVPASTSRTVSTATTTLTTNSSSSTLETLQHIARTEGVLRGLWRGNQTRLFKVAPHCAIMVSSYELGKRFLQEQE